MTAMQLCLEDFMSLKAKPYQRATLKDVCLYRRESYEAPASSNTQKGMFFISVRLQPGVCEAYDPILDMGATYTVDVLGTEWALQSRDVARRGQAAGKPVVLGAGRGRRCAPGGRHGSDVVPGAGMPHSPSELAPRRTMCKIISALPV
ncbi:hypothetical protein ACLESD_00245 [Pyxidicoccus sp. 3LFB2]